jgi:pseudaminic acid synthase
MEIDGRKIGADQPPYVIAEMSNNHLADPERAFRLIEAAARAGADAVKIQTYDADALTIDSNRAEFIIQTPPWTGKNYYQLYQEIALPVKWTEQLFRCARDNGISIFSSPFDERAVALLQSLNCPAYKVASFEACDDPLLRAVAATKKPVIISSGVVGMTDLRESLRVLRAAGASEIALLHCVSEYPALPEHMNLRALDRLAGLGCTIGLSDHSLGHLACQLAIARGAMLVEKHFTIARADGGPDADFSLEPDEFAALVAACRQAWQVLGDAGVLDQPRRRGAEHARSLFVVEPVAAGQVLEPRHVRAIRPGLGLSPRMLPQVLGRPVVRAMERGEPLRAADLAPSTTAPCPACGQQGSSSPLVALREQPVYLHPLPADAQPDGPQRMDLAWHQCGACAHAWRPDFDVTVLERIYRDFYYTPIPDGIGRQFGDDFVACLGRFGVLRPRAAVLEIGCSGGEVLVAVQRACGASAARAFEPNEENAARARARGIDVDGRFFGRDTAAGRYGLVYARHVIEHIFDFADFFAGLDAVAEPDADLVLETPSLDWHAARDSIGPFHVEHVHVFCARSLARLAALHGWAYQQRWTSDVGNLVMSFRRVAAAAPHDEPATPAGCVGLQRRVDDADAALRDACAGQRVLFWGAGSAGVKLAVRLARTPDWWVDGNPAKVGKHFAGFPGVTIEAPEAALAAARASDKPVRLFIASSFAREILPRLRALGWDREVFDHDGRLLAQG